MATKNSTKADASASAGKACSDKNCPVHGEVRTRGRSFVGTVTSDRMSKTVVVSWTRRAFVKKFERYERRLSKINAHNPDCMSAKKGDIVKISETRPLSKTKHFVVVEVLGTATKKAFVKTETIETEEERELATKKHDDKREEKRSEE